MTTGMEQFMQSWLLDPTMGQFTSATVCIGDHLLTNDKRHHKDRSRRATHAVRMVPGLCLCQDDTLGNNGEILDPPAFPTVPSRYLLNFHHPARHDQPLFLH